MSLWTEISKIPPVTRFLCGSSLAVTVPVLLEIVSPYKILFVKELVTGRWEVWRVFTSFFLGSGGINYIFEFIMLYRNADQLESQYYTGRSADLAWQLLLACSAILTLNIPLHSFVHTRPLLLALTYLTSRLAPPGTQTSLFGLLSFPIVYLPFALIGLDLLMGGRAAAAQSISGAVVGHLWWWGVWESGVLRGFGAAPGWLRALVGGGPRPGAGGAPGGVHVVPPRRLREEAQTGGYRWGTGHRLGSD
ncbi:DER1-domain-containing protein [Wolfiporia cocos MD-104 SS10]|uniref:Derlin n=1 Tax=Wolfiporia cocos (strain MD-104) TaxID=742152 RepID=A0A2H3JXU5_WOLCO|nr:DER1-domain-containing protein [Wolfiporia cocos MD-104 SS10]